MSRNVVGTIGRQDAAMKRVALLAALGLTVLIAMVVVAIGLPSSSGEESIDLGFMVFLFVGLGLYWGLGALIVIRADGHVIGWLFASTASELWQRPSTPSAISTNAPKLASLSTLP